MGQLRARRDEVAIVRVEIREPATDALIVDLLEVGRDRGADRRIGRAGDPETAGHILTAWLRDLLARARDGGRRGTPPGRDGDGAVTLDGRSRTAPPATLGDDGPEVTP